MDILIITKISFMIHTGSTLSVNVLKSMFLFAGFIIIQV